MLPTFTFWPVHEVKRLKRRIVFVVCVELQSDFGTMEEIFYTRKRSTVYGSTVGPAIYDIAQC